jgi:hypothetical protein
MANKDRIITSLNNAELCDDCLSVTSGVAPRQTVYTICRSLSESAINVFPDTVDENSNNNLLK